MFSQQVEGRKQYLEDEMIGNWSNLNMMAESINSLVQERMEKGEMSLADLASNSSSCVSLLKEISPELISTMYNKQVTGVYVVFNPNGVGFDGGINRLTGLYLRDPDPTAAPSKAYGDILVERAPVDFVKNALLATDGGWQPVFSKEDSFGKDFFFNSYFAAYSHQGEKFAATEYGYWTSEPYKLSNDGNAAIAYSLPLMLEDGTVYGVVGVEILQKYLEGFLPADELLEKSKGAYALAVHKEGEDGFRIVAKSTDGVSRDVIEGLELKLVDEENNIVEEVSGKYHVDAKKLTLYNRNGLFESEQWYLLGIGEKEALFDFGDRVFGILQLTAIATIGLGLICIIFVSISLSRPITRLAEEVERAQEKGVLPTLSETKIKEIDKFSNAIVKLEREVADASTRLKNIMDMASIDIAGYEIDDENESLFVTKNYFKMLNLEILDSENLTVAQFKKLREEIAENYFHSKLSDGSSIYKIPISYDEERYLRAEVRKEGKKLMGLVEDVTNTMQEKLRIEKERDFDVLTKLYSRWGFKRESNEIFANSEMLGTTALLMLDLDNLKRTNDEFGHEIGDLYIQMAGECLFEGIKGNHISARIAGDEFLVLFYNFEDKESIRTQIERLFNTFSETKFILPSGKTMSLSASGGVAWYSEECKTVSELMKYADFAMYEAKQSMKGYWLEFNEEAYKKKQYKNQCSMEFYQFIKNREVNYHYQPIFSSRDGSVYAYEALMRVNFPALRTPDMVMRLAKETNKLAEIENITMFKSAEFYGGLLEEGKVSEDALLFVNSIGNVCLSDRDLKLFHEQFAWMQPKIVLEITETEQLDMNIVKKKAEAEGFSGMFALDDYGSGYNSEINLLELNPKVVKVDITIVRDIHLDKDKQQIIKNIVNYARGKDMLVLAEGIENAEELTTIIELGVDLLQGYYLGKPALVPPQISPEAMQTIMEANGAN